MSRDLFFCVREADVFVSSRLKRFTARDDIVLKMLYLVDLTDGWENVRKSDLSFLLGGLGGNCSAWFPLAELDWKRSLHFQGKSFFVGSRRGTLSSWSSMAKEILDVCGLKGVRRIERIWAIDWRGEEWKESFEELFYDRMTEAIFYEIEELAEIFEEGVPRSFEVFSLGDEPFRALRGHAQALGLQFSEDEVRHLLQHYVVLGRAPTDVELMMYGQINSEHCRHKVFRGAWTIDGKRQSETLLGLIRMTYEKNPEDILVAYEDNAAVFGLKVVSHFYPAVEEGIYRYEERESALLIKAETHNHPTAIAPYEGAATGVGGEIRDEASVGRGSRFKAGFAGFCVSDLERELSEEFLLREEKGLKGAEIGGGPNHLRSALEIMLEAPLGSSRFANEFGRPTLLGYFRAFEQQIKTENGGEWRGYRKPIMIAGGLGQVFREEIRKCSIPVGAPIVVMGGPALLIGLGGGSASSGEAHSEEQLFASVQRANPEMQRRCQEVIDACQRLGEENPILAIHDVGAGGLSNAIPELLHQGGVGARLDLRKIPNDEPKMTPLEIWCNESQERYVLAVEPERWGIFEELCHRERCPFAILGEATEERRLLVFDSFFGDEPVDLSMDFLFETLPQVHRRANQVVFHREEGGDVLSGVELVEAARRVLQNPAVGSKQFLITINDRSVTGLVARDPMVGPWQIPIADVGAVFDDFRGSSGEVMALGERPVLSLLDGKASVEMALGELVTNILAAPLDSLSSIKLSANWMAAIEHESDDTVLFEMVRHLALELCVPLGMVIPVGKDSLSMKVVWEEGDIQRVVVSPPTLVLSGFAAIEDVEGVLTPELKSYEGETSLVLIDLGRGQDRLGGSILLQAYERLGGEPPRLDEPQLLEALLLGMRRLRRGAHLLAYHDRSDGGLWATICEMSFGGRLGVKLELDFAKKSPFHTLFSEELGVVLQVPTEEMPLVYGAFEGTLLEGHVHFIGEVLSQEVIEVHHRGEVLFRGSRVEWQKLWTRLSFRMASLRDEPRCALEEFRNIEDLTDGGLFSEETFELLEEGFGGTVGFLHQRPKVAILREQGSNGHLEMAAAFTEAGFLAVDVTMTDLVERRTSLVDFQGFAAVGGFSYGDVLGAGVGWAASILLNAHLHDEFAHFFQRGDTFALGVCNGCQMMAHLKELIPNAEHFPQFVFNRSEQFESRFSMVEILDSPSIFFRGMVGSRIPIISAHAEGRVVLEDVQLEKIQLNHLASLRYIDNKGLVTERYPYNPNGSPFGLTAFTNGDGRFTIMMPHPERLFLSSRAPWRPKHWKKYSPWFRIFQNARYWLD